MLGQRPRSRGQVAEEGREDTGSVGYSPNPVFFAADKLLLLPLSLTVDAGLYHRPVFSTLI